MNRWLQLPTHILLTLQQAFWTMIVVGMLVSPTQATEIFHLQLNAKPFSHNLCHKSGMGGDIRIKAARHRDLVIQRLPGQHVPDNSFMARSKDYTYFITLSDLSNGALPHGSIAFRTNRAVIFTSTEPEGISRQAFMSTLPPAKQPIANQTLNTFLRLQRILQAAIDTCRPYPPTVTYDTDDEIDRIETGRWKFQTLVKAYNENPQPQRPLYIHETGMSEGFYDPTAGQHARVSYEALNPLSFYKPQSNMP